MFFRHSNIKKESALNLAGLNYQKGDIDLKIQDYLKASSSEPSVEEITSFIIVLRYCRNVRPTWVKFDSKDTKESEWCLRF